MLLIYSINLETLEIKIWDKIETIIQVPDLLKNIITQFIANEQGVHKASNAFKDNVKDDQITEDGYFVRASSVKKHEYDVYMRTTVVAPARLWGFNINISVKKVFKFGVIEASLDVPIEVSTGVTVKHPEMWLQAETEKEVTDRRNLMIELATTLAERKKKVD